MQSIHYKKYPEKENNQEKEKKENTTTLFDETMETIILSFKNSNNVEIISPIFINTNKLNFEKTICHFNSETIYKNTLYIYDEEKKHMCDQFNHLLNIESYNERPGKGFFNEDTFIITFTHTNEHKITGINIQVPTMCPYIDDCFINKTIYKKMTQESFLDLPISKYFTYVPPSLIDTVRCEHCNHLTILLPSLNIRPEVSITKENNTLCLIVPL
jgi:hypothetical protein